MLTSHPGSSSGRPRWAYLALCLAASVAAAGCDAIAYRPIDRIDHAEKLIKQGWIPGTLPPSTHNIRYRLDLDHIEADGTFEYDVLETDLLVERGAIFVKKPKFKQGTPQQKALDEGYEFYHSSGSGAGHLIAVKRGQGQFWMWGGGAH